MANEFHVRNGIISHGDIDILGNKVTTSVTNSDLTIEANGTGRVKLNNMRFPSSDSGHSGKVLSTNGSGDLSWITPSGGGTSDRQVFWFRLNHNGTEFILNGSNRPETELGTSSWTFEKLTSDRFRITHNLNSGAATTKSIIPSVTAFGYKVDATNGDHYSQKHITGNPTTAYSVGHHSITITADGAPQSPSFTLYGFTAGNTNTTTSQHVWVKVDLQ